MACPELPRLSGSGGAPRFAAERAAGGSTRGDLFLLGGVGGGPGGRVSQGRGDVVQLDTMGALPVAAEAVRVEADPLDPVELAAEAVGDRVYLVGLGRELAGEGAYRTDIHSGEAGHRRTFLRVSCVLLQVLQRYPRAGWRGMGQLPVLSPPPPSRPGPRMSYRGGRTMPGQAGSPRVPTGSGRECGTSGRRPGDRARRRARTGWPSPVPAGPSRRSWWPTHPRPPGAAPRPGTASPARSARGRPDRWPAPPRSPRTPPPGLRWYPRC